MKQGDWVQTQTQDRYNDQVGEIVEMVPQGFYPYGVDLDETGIVYFAESELTVTLTAEEIPEASKRIKKKIDALLAQRGHTRNVREKKED